MIQILLIALSLGSGRGAVSATPCFPGPPLVATEMFKTLEKYAWSLYLGPDEAAPPPTTYGSCTVNRNIITSAAGRTVAELGCGVRVLSPGIVDELGLQLGARGQDVLDRKAKPVPALSCMANGPDQVRCMFERRDDKDTDETWYVVAGTLSEDVLTGPAARRYFATRSIVEMEVSVWCH
ncbi:MAG: hypothetical protein ABI175_27860 [Polyangiales bacterium]